MVPAPSRGLPPYPNWQRKRIQIPHSVSSSLTGGTHQRESGAQRTGRLGHRRPAPRAQPDHVDEPVHQVRLAAQHHRHAGVGEPSRVHLPLVPNRVESRRDQVGRRHPGEVVGQQDRGPRIAAVDGRRHVVVAEPDDVGVGQQESGGEELAGRRPIHRVTRRIEQQQEGRHRLGAADGQMRRRRREIRARTVPAHRDRGRIGTQFRRVLAGETVRRHGIVDRGRERDAPARAGSRRPAPGPRPARREGRTPVDGCPDCRSPSRRRGDRPAAASRPAGRPGCTAGQRGRLIRPDRPEW